MSQSSVRFGSLLAVIAAILPLAGCDSGSATAQGDPPTPALANPATVQVEPTAPPAVQGSSHPPAGSTLSGASDMQKPKPSRMIDATFDDIKFEIEPGAPFSRDMLTSEIESLAGQRIRIRGYILPTAQSRGIKQFVLVRDNQECCFGPGAALYDCILVEMQPGKTAAFSVRPVAVEGTFHIDLRSDIDGQPLAVYRLEAESVER